MCFVQACFACQGKERLDPEIEKLGRATGPTESVAPASAPGASVRGIPSRIHRGRVLETMDASRYTYLRMETGERIEMWAAVPKSEIRVGQWAVVAESLVMRDFSSPTLNRTFKTIIFGTLDDSPFDGGVGEKDVQSALPPNHPKVD